MPKDGNKNAIKLQLTDQGVRIPYMHEQPFWLGLRHYHHDVSLREGSSRKFQLELE